MKYINKNIFKRAILILFLFIFVLVFHNNLKAEDGRNVEDIEFIQDVVPKTLAFSFETPDDILYYRGDTLENIPEHYRPLEDLPEYYKILNETYFPYYENGEIHPPKKYEVEKRYTKEDIKKMKLALKAAHRYADINKAFEDGYRLRDLYQAGMGIHMVNVEYVMSDEVDVEKPEFLTYIKNRKTGRFQLIMLGYVHRGHTDKKRYELFDTPEAQGHFHPDPFCFRVEHNILHLLSYESCGEKSADYNVGHIWMMHLAVNMYNDQGIFSDFFTYVDYLSVTGTTHSFYGKKEVDK